MPVVMEMTLLLLFFGGFWAQEVNPQSLEVSTPINAPFSSVPPTTLEVTNLNSVSSDYTTTRIPEKNDSTGHQIIPPSSTPTPIVNEVSSPETPISVSDGLSIAEPTISHEASTEKSSMSQEISNVTSNPTPPAMSTLGFHIMSGGTMATSNLETSSGTSGPPVSTATSSEESSTGTSGPPVTMATSSLKTSNGTSEPLVTMATSSQESSTGTSGPLVTMATSSQESSKGTSGPLVTMATSSQDSSNGTSGLPVTVATSSLETSKGTSGSPISGVKIAIMTTPKTSTNTGSGLSSNSDQRTKNTLLVAVLMALLVGIVLLALLMLWRQRQKRRTGALTLNGGGKRNGVVDAWAGPAQVSDEGAVITTAGVSGGDKDSGIPEGEGPGHRPTLTTFFGRRKSRQASVALEELKAVPAASLMEEEEPLVGSENGDVEAPASDGLEAGDVEVP
ncbi:leukosialin [Pteronotus mesoamericanus]|uniref:leukosialin n=1 Tax=Pteronotus mesoamericanus TaxID=1884717 RepID=UPI0023ED48A8|nr:leukosialin [Pteronotus parnellii mesoamericanus]